MHTHKLINECRLLILFDFQLTTLIFSGTEQFFPGTQAFTNPPDMASSGVWENIILCKTPTFDGECRIFLYIIFIHNLILMIAKGLFLYNMLTDGKSTFNVGYDRCGYHVIISIIVVGRCYLPRI